MRHTFKYSETISINYEKHGNGARTIVLLHGFGASLETWRDVAPILSRRYTIYLVDLKGFGLSSKPAANEYTAFDQAKIVASFLDHIGNDHVLLGGNSFGGAVALVTVSIRVQALILINTPTYPQDLPFYISVLRVPVLNRVVLALLSPKQMARLVLRQVFWNQELVTEERVERHSQFLSLPGMRQALIATAKQILPRDWDEFLASLRRVQLPTQIIWGTEDQVIPYTHAQRLHNDIGTSRLEYIVNCGHVPQEECPAATAALMDSFINDLTTGPLTRPVSDGPTT